MKSDPSNGFFGDHQNIYSKIVEIGINARFVIDKIWESVKFFTTVATSILSVTVVVLTFVLKDMPTIFSDVSIKILLSLLPIILISVSVIGILNLKREYRHFLSWVVLIQKLYELLGINKKYSFKIYPGDDYLLPRRFTPSQFDKGEDFIKAGLKNKNTLFHHFRLLHILFIFLGFLLIGLVLLANPPCSAP